MTLFKHHTKALLVDILLNKSACRLGQVGEINEETEKITTGEKSLEYSGLFNHLNFQGCSNAISISANVAI